MTFEEFSKLHQVDETVVKIPDFVPYNAELYETDESFTAPPSVDWRDRGVVSNVKDQKHCGSCYAMATISSIESQLILKTGKVVELSVQEIVDCARNYETFGCDGGLKFRVFDYVKDNSGITSALDYPYVGANGECKSSRNVKVPIKLKSFVELKPKDEEMLKQAVAQVGPIVVAMDINHESLMRYSGGIYYEPNCSDDTNHALLLVGYGNVNGTDFWIVKNSFGVKWGEGGFLRIARNLKNHCGIASESYYPEIS